MGFLKRFLPFFATFVVGLFIASFFVSVGFPRIEDRRGHNHKCDRKGSEIEQLRRENLELRRQLEQLENDVPEVVSEVPIQRVPLRVLPMESVPQTKGR
jgi:hypothetical protein